MMSKDLKTEADTTAAMNEPMPAKTAMAQIVQMIAGKRREIAYLDKKALNDISAAERAAAHADLAWDIEALQVAWRALAAGTPNDKAERVGTQELDILRTEHTMMQLQRDAARGIALGLLNAINAAQDLATVTRSPQYMVADSVIKILQRAHVWEDVAAAVRDYAVIDWLQNSIKKPFDVCTHEEDGRLGDSPPDVLFRVRWHEDRGDPSVGIYGWSGFVLADDQAGTWLDGQLAAIVAARGEAKADR